MFNFSIGLAMVKSPDRQIFLDFRVLDLSHDNWMSGDVAVEYLCMRL